MSFGPTPAIGAHTKGHALAPRRDRSVEAEHTRNPPVPRTKRAPPRANSAGAFNRAAFDRRSPSSRPGTPSKASEQRRPRAESPFSYARVSCLTREREAPENQRFEMGPPPKIPDGPLFEDYSKNHILSKGHGGGEGGMPWTDAATVERGRPPADPARKNTLMKERQSAEQSLEWGPNQRRADSVDPSLQCHARVSTLRREEKDSQAHMHIDKGFGGAGNTGSTGAGDHNRRNVMRREMYSDRGGGMPDVFNQPPNDDSVPSFGRRNLISKDQPRQVPAH